jgi:hypothetical protein
LLPGWFWDSLKPVLKTRERSNFELYYSEDSYWSQNAIKTIKSFFLFSTTRCTPISTLYSQEESQGWLIVRNYNGELNRNKVALISLLRASYILFPLGYLLAHPKMSFLLRTIDSIAGTLHKRFESKQQRHNLEPEQETTKFPLIQNFIAACYLISLLLYTGEQFGHSRLPDFIKPVWYASHMTQMWLMYSPDPPNESFWMNIDAYLENGSNVDLYRFYIFYI